MSGPHPRTSRTRLRLDVLEDRCTPACLITTADGGHTLVITGDGGKNYATIRQDDAANLLSVTCGSQSRSYQSSVITRIEVELKGDNDTFFWGLVEDTSFVYSKDAVINTGGSSDHVGINMNDGYGGGAWDFGNLDIQILTGGGKDYLNAAFGHNHGNRAHLYADLGAGDDEALVKLYGDVSGGADVSISLHGNTGNDELEISNSSDNQEGEQESIDLSYGSSLALIASGGDGNDTITVTHKGVLDGYLYLHLDGATDNDQITADLRLKSGSDGIVEAQLLGGDDDDRMRFWLIDDDGQADIAMAVMNGGDGFDRYAWSTSPSVSKSGFEGIWFNLVPAPMP